jgi:hypothetical protein
MLRILEAEEATMSTTEERDAERRRSAEKALRRETTVRRIKDIVWSAVIASVITIIVVLSLGWLTTQAVVERAREEEKRTGGIKGKHLPGKISTETRCGG